MFNRLIPYTLFALLLTGCSSASVDQTAPPTVPAQQAQHSESQAPAPEPQVQPVFRLADEEIDFDNLRIEADISDQMVYVKQDEQTVRAMPTSSGLDEHPDNSTPRGEFVVEPERGEWFFAPQYGEGAQYWVSWKNHGEFLFHSVVMDENRQIIEAEAQKLGTKASHGCFRLAVEDAKWLYENIRTGTKVLVRD